MDLPVFENTASKEEIRKHMIELAGRQSDADSALRTERILSSLEEKEEFKKAGTILLYSSTAGEVATSDFIRKWSEYKEIVLPCVISETEMELRKYHPGRMVKGAFSIMEPDKSCERVSADRIELAVVPGVAFAPIRDDISFGGVRYARLGRGKGYYDRLLPKLKCRTIGICFPFRVLENIPQSEYDQCVDECIF